MRFFQAALLVLPWVASALGQESSTPKEKHEYQSDVARLRRIVINSLYSHRDVFLRELISNANDALEKLRITALTDKSLLQAGEPLNITIKLLPSPAGTGEAGRVVITDTGVGMTPEELTQNLGTLAKSGTSDFLVQAEGASTSQQGNLIGQFGLGFYSSFLVADHVYVASVPAARPEGGEREQWVFASGAEDQSFEVYPDPRGRTLEHGTEITLVVRDDAKEFVDPKKVKELVEKHSSFSTTYPIYLYTLITEEVPDEEASSVPIAESLEHEAPSASPKSEADEDSEAAIVEDLPEESEDTAPVTPPLPPMKNVTREVYEQLNDQPPIWVCDAKTVSDEEYNEFYKSTFKDSHDPLAHLHFAGDSGSTVSFKSLLYIPSELPPDFWSSQMSRVNGVRLMVKRVFITNDLGDDALPKWISWLRAIVDADDLPLNVSREQLQSTKFLAQIKSILVKRAISLLQKLANAPPSINEETGEEEGGAKYKEVWKAIGSAIKMGAMEGSAGQKNKLGSLTRWATNTREFVGLDDYVSNRKKGQKQIFYLAGVGQRAEDLAKSVFIEKLHARGYEVLLLTEPMDEILLNSFQRWGGLTFQDVAKKGLKYGDEDLDAEADKTEQATLAVRFAPLLGWLKQEYKGTVMDVVISNRLVTSPCAIVADQYGYSANMERLMAAQQRTAKDSANDWMAEFARKQRSLEINPKSPLIEGMLRVVQGLDWEEDVLSDEGDKPSREITQAEFELKEVAQILLDGALVRSGFEVSDPNTFFSRVDIILRRSLGVSETAQAKVDVRPAPPVETGPLDWNFKQHEPELEFKEDPFELGDFDYELPKNPFSQEPEAKAFDEAQGHDEL
ncbi:heat shock protein Hsp90 [Dacryopinax primogenitus]|uniref:Heat shock protein Hsp90 n=1 Tax=Dacryopinax primogenitus (strain DJM 731) TaxID=1858805 RepID=M5GBS0_DACPD|nr:heat shock protein Hsp90 [Dacryopinax primogenitus]EJU06434.1 heat shock protein Hsp90 [Dacryopinax primogenitus]